ncbi:MAG: type II secretion system F family protein [Clostridia bacterium]|nr:type II secretion system F family protein [Clostridia bacterium]
MPVDARVVVALAFLAAFWLVGLAAAAWDLRRDRERERLKALREASGLPASAPEAEAAPAAGERGERRLLSRLRRRPRAREGRARRREGDEPAPRRPEGARMRIARRLRRAGLPWRVEEFLTLQATCAVVMAPLLSALGHSWAWAPIGLALGWLGPELYLNRRVARRLARIAGDLPGALSMMSGALKSGHSFLQAAETVARELGGPLGEEFEQLVHEVRLNVSMEDALANLVDRVRQDDLDLVVTAVLIQRQVGGNLAQVIDQIAATIRERIRLKGEVRVLTSQGRLSGWIVGALPVALLFLISLINPAYVGPLFSTALGQALLLAAAVMELLGALIIRRIVQVDF